MTRTLTRRGIVKAAPAAIIAASLPALAGTHLDAELLALREPYKRTLAAIEAVSPAHTRAEKAVISAMLAQPGRDRDNVEKELGFDVAEARYDAAVDANTDVINQIAETPARTMEGSSSRQRSPSTRATTWRSRHRSSLTSWPWEVSMHDPVLVSRRSLAAALPLAAFAGASTAAAAVVAATAGADPVLAQIELHKVLRIRANTMPNNDEDPAYMAACTEEEAALQSLGDMVPATTAGAAAQLRYMADVEGCFADKGSPLLRTVVTVAQALAVGLPT